MLLCVRFHISDKTSTTVREIAYIEANPAYSLEYNGLMGYDLVFKVVQGHKNRRGMGGSTALQKLPYCYNIEQAQL